mmetsp:Transcript_18129/g.27898  ORF Transcript_18129/g.27898 Transcript_18129/m.27898 type:complete len:88 (-) Transcript_18129:8-271(-)
MFMNLLVVLAFGSCFIVNEIHAYQPAVPFFCMFVIGMIENSAKSFNYIVLGFEFEKKIVALQVQQFVESLATFIFIVMIPLLDIQLD